MPKYILISETAFSLQWIQMTASFLMILLNGHQIQADFSEGIATSRGSHLRHGETIPFLLSLISIFTFLDYYYQ